MVDDGDWVRRAYLLHQPQGIVECPFNRQHFGPMNQRLREFPQSDIGIREQHHTVQPRPCRIRRRRRARVAGGRANDGFCAFFDSFGDGQCHAPVLKRSGGIHPLELEHQL